METVLLQSIPGEADFRPWAIFFSNISPSYAGGTEKEKEKEKDDAGVLSDLEAEMPEDEQDDDYAVDHYESGDESAGDDEPAAVF